MKTIRSIKDIWKKLMYILTPVQKRIGIFVFVMTVGGAGVETLGVSAILPLVQALMDVEQIMEVGVVKKLTAFFHISEVSHVILFIGAGTILIFILKNVYLFVLLFVRNKYAYKVQRELSVKIMQSYMKRNYAFFLNYSTEECMRGVQDDVKGVFAIIDNGLALLAEVLTIGCICIFIMMTDVGMAFVMVGLALICVLLVYNFFRKWMRRLGEKNREYGPLVTKYTFEAFQGIKEIIITGRQSYFTNNYEKALNRLQNVGIRVALATASPAYLIESLCIAGLLGVVCWRVVGAGSAEEMIPQLSAFAIAAFRILPSLGKISSYFNNFMYACPSLDATFANMKEVEEYENNVRGEVEKYEGDVTDEKLDFKQSVRLTDICWHYPNSGVFVLDHLNLEIQKGKAVAFIGESGAGKSTLADVILGILCPQKGTIEMDGINVRRMGKAWSRLVGYVPQSVFLTNDTIRNNVAFGIEKDDIDDNAVWKALEMAQLKNYVSNLPEQLDTRVGERGVRFSGGQRQRIAIARALYYNPEILILDEATSALDGETEKAVMESVEALSGYKTLIIVAHRLTTIRKCDEIYEIANGKAVLRNKEEVLKDV